MNHNQNQHIFNFNDQSNLTNTTVIVKIHLCFVVILTANCKISTELFFYHTLSQILWKRKEKYPLWFFIFLTSYVRIVLFFCKWRLHMLPLFQNCTIFNPKATGSQIKVPNQILFNFSFKTIDFFADVFSCNPLILYQRKNV